MSPRTELWFPDPDDAADGVPRVSNPCFVGCFHEHETGSPDYGA